MAHMPYQDDWQALDKRSAHAGTAISRLVLEHSPVVFPCRYSPEDMVLLDLIGRYRFPVRVIVWDAGIGAEEVRALRSFMERRYVFAAPVLHVHDDRRQGLRSATAAMADEWEFLAVQISGCRAWLTGSRSEQAFPARAPAVIEQDVRRQCVRSNPIVDWDALMVASYLHRWEVPSRSPGDDPALRAA